MNSIPQFRLGGPLGLLPQQSPQGAFEPASAEQSPVDVFREQARAKLGMTTPERLELGALLLWEKSITASSSSETAYTPTAGAMNGYLTALAWCMGNSSGALAPAILEQACAFKTGQLLEKSNNGSTYLGTSPAYAGQVSVQEMLDDRPEFCQGVRCTGLWNDNEKQSIEPALVQLKEHAPRLFEKLKTIVVQTWLGSEDPSSLKGTSNVNGCYNSLSSGVLKLCRLCFNDPKSMAAVIYHEFAHVMDASEGRGFKSEQVPVFQNMQQSRNCVSKYAEKSPVEDFAETFSFAIKNYDMIHDNPDIYFHGLGALSEKFKYVFKNVLGEKIPPPSSRWTEMKERIKAGDSPFGWVMQDGRIEQSGAEMKASLREIALDWDLKNPGKNMQYMSDSLYRDKLEFLAENLLGWKPDGEARKAPRARSIDSIAGAVEEYRNVTDMLAKAKGEMEIIEGKCKDSVEHDLAPSEVPAEIAEHTGFLYGMKALDLHSKEDWLRNRPEKTWKEECLKIDDAPLRRRLQQCNTPAEVMTALTERAEELLDLRGILKKRAESENVEQPLEKLREKNAALNRRKFELAQLFEGCGPRLEENLAEYHASKSR